MIILLNKYKYIESYATIGSLKNGMEIEVLSKNLETENFLDYQYINGELFYNPIPYDSKPLGANIQYTGSEWIDEGTPQEKQAFWRNELIKVNNQIKELQEIGLGGGAEENKLRAKLEEYRTQYMNAVHEEALEADKALSTPTTLEEE